MKTNSKETIKIMLVCPNCNNSTWLRLNASEFECLSCGDIYDTEDMCTNEEDIDKEYKQKCEELKRKCFDLGADAMEDLLGVSLEFETDEAMFEFADDILAQMPDEEFEMLYDRYCGGN